MLTKPYGRQFISSLPTAGWKLMMANPLHLCLWKIIFVTDLNSNRTMWWLPGLLELLVKFCGATTMMA